MGGSGWWFAAGFVLAGCGEIVGADEYEVVASSPTSGGAGSAPEAMGSQDGASIPQQTIAILDAQTPECADCAVNECLAETAACAEDADCSEFATCLGAAGPSFSERRYQCYQAHEKSPATERWNACLVRSGCYTNCAECGQWGETFAEHCAECMSETEGGCEATSGCFSDGSCSALVACFGERCDGWQLSPRCRFDCESRHGRLKDAAAGVVGPLGRCRQQCQWGHHWSCGFGGLTGTGSGDPATVEMKVKLASKQGEGLTAQVAACRGSCSEPSDTDSDGVVVLAVETSNVPAQGGYHYEITSEHAPHLFYPWHPTVDGWSGDVLVSHLPVEDPERGDVLVIVGDCVGSINIQEQNEGVRIALEGSSGQSVEPLYLLNYEPSAALDGGDVAVFHGVEPGTATVDVVSPSGDVVVQAPVEVRSGWVTSVVFNAPVFLF